jgi:hypothetical protein
MVSAPLIANFWKMFGDERATKFVLALHQRSRIQGRLQFWQESMLEEFYRNTETAPLDFKTVLSTFNICPVHQAELLEDTVSIEYGTRKALKPAEIDRANNTYPFASTVKYGPCWVEAKTTATVFYCPACRDALRNERA